MPTIIRASDRTFRIHLKNGNGEPYNLSMCTAMKAIFKDQDDAVQNRTLADGHLTIVNAGGGLVDINLVKDFTQTLKIGERQEFQLEAVVDSKTIRVSFPEALTVLPRLEDD